MLRTEKAKMRIFKGITVAKKLFATFETRLCVCEEFHMGTGKIKNLKD